MKTNRQFTSFYASRFHYSPRKLESFPPYYSWIVNGRLKTIYRKEYCLKNEGKLIAYVGKYYFERIQSKGVILIKRGDFTLFFY